MKLAGEEGFEPPILGPEPSALPLGHSPIFTPVIIPKLSPNSKDYYTYAMAAIQKEYLRSVLFGIEDSLVSTTGLIAGLSVGAENKRIVVLGGLVAIVIEAVSMGAGEYLSDDAVQELDKLKRHRDSPAASGLLMLVSYLLAGMIPLAPVLVFVYPTSLILSVIFALSGLFLLGYIKGRLLHSRPFRGGLKILVVGGLAAILGLGVGFIFRV